MRVAVLKFAPLAVLMAFGCTPRWQGAEGFVSATTPVDYAAERQKEDAWKGDPYAFGGTAAANGGLKTRTQYGFGAKGDDGEALNLKQIEPAKGTGQNNGELPVWADPSHGNSNAPANQPPVSSGNVGQ